MARFPLSLFLIIPCIIYLVWFLGLCTELKKIQTEGIVVADGGGLGCTLRGIFSNQFMTGNAVSALTLGALIAVATIVIVLWNFIWINTRGRDSKN